MSGGGLGKLRFLLLVVSVFVLSADALRQLKTLSKEEESEVEFNRQLKQLNKPAIKTFRNEFGDIIDCVDIYKQPSFDHPLLKNHIIQMKPTTIPRGHIDDASKAKRLLQHIPNINSCPPGSVPIKRTTKEDLIAARSFKPLWSHQATDNLRPSATIDVEGYHVAMLNYNARVLGAKSQINVWNPIPSMDQYSTASMWLSQGARDQQTTIQVGWGVLPRVFQNVTRLSIYWTADGYQRTGCYNQLCPGFVQISSTIMPGLPLRPISTYNGPQYAIPISVHQDTNTGNWMLMIGEEYIGYWPKALLPALANGTAVAAWGGEVYSPATEASPAMGSGHFPDEGYGKSAFVNQIEVTDSVSKGFIHPLDSLLSVVVDNPVCFGIIRKFSQSSIWGHHIFFGGPKGCK